MLFIFIHSLYYLHKQLKHCVRISKYIEFIVIVLFLRNNLKIKALCIYIYILHIHIYIYVHIYMLHI